MIRPAVIVFLITLIGSPRAAESFTHEALPILEKHCYECHADGAGKGQVVLDEFTSLEAMQAQPELWTKVLKNVRSGLMPPSKEPRLAPEEMSQLVDWLKRVPLKLDAAHPDPGRVTLHRLNRGEYRNTIRDLMGIDFRTDEEFPADDTGYGFDTIADVLSTSPLLMEKYLMAAETIVTRAVPLESRTVAVQTLNAGKFTINGEVREKEGLRFLSFYDPHEVTGRLQVKQEGTYRLTLDARVRGSFAYDPGRAKAEFMLDDQPQWQEELKWQDGKSVNVVREIKLTAGEHAMKLTLEPLLGKDQKPKENPGDGPSNVELHFAGVILEGPLEPEFAIHPANYDRFFPRPEIPADPAERRAYAAEILRRMTTLAFRRPVDEPTVERLVKLAEASGPKFEYGIARALAAVLSSPRFLFRMEETLPEADPQAHPQLDEYALASRLSFFLWSTMPDRQLFQLAEKGELRKNLFAQVQRMLLDGRAQEFVENFAGQWLQTRDVMSVSIDARIVQARDAGTEKEMRARVDRFKEIQREIDQAEKARDDAKIEALKAERKVMRDMFGAKRIEFSEELRRAMRKESEMWFRYLLREDRSVLELIETNRTFLNEVLANHYGIPDVKGMDMRLVDLPPESVRGGILTMGTTLAVTSNPTRTSPVKRGMFILENILGTPPPPPPPDIPSLESSEQTADGHEPSLRETLAKHREAPLCFSCHNRMDPLGLALENFNAMGLWRDKEKGQPIPVIPGQLATGEAFADVRDLKHILVTERRLDFYRCLTEKLLTYSLGRGPEVGDISTVDAIVEKLESSSGKFSTLLMGIIESPAFQQRRRSNP